MSKRQRIGLVWLMALAIAALLAVGSTALAEITVTKTGDGSCVSDSDHTWQEDHTDPATCTQTGTRYYVCSTCGAEGTEEIPIDPANHVGETEVRNAVNATCTEQGYTGDTYCKSCNAKLQDGTIIDPLNHSWGEVTYSWADDLSTCTASRVCTRDSAHVDSETVNTTLNTVKSVDPTCTTAGKKVVNAIFSNGVFGTPENEMTLEALNHSWGDVSYVWSGDYKTCTATRVCSRNTEHVETETVNSVLSQTPATCDADGKDTYTATFTTNPAFAQQTTEIVLPKTGHAWSDISYTWSEDHATCTAARTCANDASHNQSETATAAVTETATCEAAGKRIFTASFTNPDFAQQTYEMDMAALGHKWSEVSYTWSEDHATCTATRTCANDTAQTHPQTETVKAVVTTTATCEAAGKSTYTATFTNPEFKAQTYEADVPALGHSWGKVTYKWSKDHLTCTASRTCKLDKTHTESEEAKAVVTEVAATATQTGLRTYAAAFKNADFEAQSYEEVIPAVTIASYEALGEVYMSYKPDVKFALSLMPTWTKVKLSDGTEAEAEVKWNNDSAPADYAEKTGDGKYVFTAAKVTTEGKHAMAEGLAMPTCTLVVAPFTFEDEFATYTYRLDESLETTIEKCVPKKPEVTVPAEFDGSKVVHIAEGAFKKLEELTRLELPAGLKTIGIKAFTACPKLETVVIPDSLETFGTEMFKDDAALKHLVLRTDLASTLTAANTVTHQVDQDKEKIDVIIEMPMNFTDIIVNTDKFTLDSDFTVAAECALTVNATGTMIVAENRTLKNLGTVQNDGKLVYHGKIVTCGGTWAGTAPGKRGNGEYVDKHVYQGGVCTGCGLEEQVTVTDVTISYVGSGLNKVYDKTRNVTVTGADFRINGVLTDHSDVRITGIRAAYDAADVGERKVSISFTLGGNDVNWYRCSDITVSAKITPKPLIITPNEEQKKFYGAADPTYFTGKVKGLLQGDTITGRLSREPGENVGQYKILQGTIDAGANYEVQMEEEYFTIEAKSINSTDVGLVTIGNQRYTGKAIEPEITMRYGTLTLKKDTDFKATYTNNTQIGTATVKLNGIGNYTGERETTFRIMDIGGGGGGTGGGGSGSGGSGGGSTWDDDEDDDEDDDDFDDGSDEFEDEFDDEFDDEDEEEYDEDEDIGHLILEDVDYGVILLDGHGEAAPFMTFDAESSEDAEGTADAEGGRVLNLMPDPLMDEATGDSIYLEGTTREQYDELHLRLSPSLAQTLAEQGYTAISYQLEQAEIRIPLAAVVAELPLDTPDPVEIEPAGEEVTGLVSNDGVDIETAGDSQASELEMEVAPRALEVDAYDICLEQADVLKAEIEALRTAEAAEAADASQAEPAEPAEADADSEAEAEDPVALTERELALLDEYTLMAPAYRLRVRVIEAGQEPEATGETDQNGLPVTALVPKPLPEGVYPLDIQLLVLPDITVDEEFEGAQAVRVALLASAEDPDDVELTPAQFEDVDGMFYALYPLTRDGLYALSAPEGYEDMLEDEAGDVVLDEDWNESETEDEDFDDAEDEEFDAAGDENYVDDFDEGE